MPAALNSPRVRPGPGIDIRAPIHPEARLRFRLFFGRRFFRRVRQGVGRLEFFGSHWIRWLSLTIGQFLVFRGIFSCRKSFDGPLYPPTARSAGSHHGSFIRRSLKSPLTCVKSLVKKQPVPRSKTPAPLGIHAHQQFFPLFRPCGAPCARHPKICRSVIKPRGTFPKGVGK
jgi:hypothetical protein